MDELLRDLRYALRLLRKAPAFALAAIGTLALGIGANVAVFSVVYGVLVRPLPYRDAGRLIVAHPEVDYAGAHRPVAVFVQPNEVEFWNRQFDTIEPPALFSMAPYALAGDSGAEVIDAAIVSGSFFATLSGPISAGRPLQASDDAMPSAVISARLARRLFHDPAAAIGRRLTLNSHAYTIAGVAGDAFQFPDARRDVWLPAGFERATSPTQCCGFSVIARLRPEATVDRGRDEIASAFTESSAAKPSNQGQVHTRIESLVDETVASVRPALLVLLAAVLMVLVVACSNLVNLLLARNAARAREFAVRRALGASAHRLMRQVLAESALLALAGGVCGAALAGPCVAVLARIARSAVPRLDDVRLDWPVLLFAAAVAAVAAIGTGILPALAVVRSPSAPNQSAAATSTQPARRLQKAVSAAQVALAVVLLAGTALLGRSLARLLAVDLGVSTDHVLTAPIDLAFSGRPRDAEALARVDRVIEQVKRLPGVRAVGIGTSLPPWPSRLRLTLKREGDAVDYQASAVPATPGYFSALHMRLIKGRFFTDADDDRHPPVMMMSEATARRFFGDGDPLGRTMELPVLRDGTPAGAEMTLVGIVANVSNAGLGAPADDSVFRPFAQQPWMSAYLVVRTDNDPRRLAASLRRTIAIADPAAVPGAIVPLDRIVADEAAQPAFRTILLASLAALAIAIAVVGLYGAISYAVSQRTREIGIRVALGATSGAVQRAVVGDGMAVAAAGIAIGTAGALAMARLLTGLLFGVTPADPVSYAGAAIGLLVLSIVAAYIPARRAARVDPTEALRHE